MNVKKFCCIGLILITIGAAQAEPIDSLFAVRIAAEQLTDTTTQQQFDYHFYQGLNYLKNNKLDSAYTCFNTCCSLKPTEAEPYFQISKIHQFSSHQDSAITYLNKAIKLDKSNLYYKEIAAAYKIAKHNYKDAAKDFEKLLEKDPDNETYIYRLIDLYRVLKKPKMEIAMFDRLERLKGISEELSLSKIDILINQKQNKKVIEEFNKLCRKFPYERRYPVLLGDFYLLIGKHNEGVACYTNALAKDSTNGYAKISLYQYYDKTGDQVKADYYLASGLLDGSIDLSLKLDYFKKHIANLISESKNAEAEEFFGKMLQIHPNELEIYKFYLSFLLHEKRYTEVIDNLKTMLAIEPEDEDTWLDLLSVETEFEPEAVPATLQTALSYFPKNLNLIQFQINYHVAKRNYTEAKQLCDNAIEITKEKKDNMRQGVLLATKGEIYAKEDSLAMSCAYYEQALVFLPNYSLLLNNYAYQLALCDTNLRQAEQMSSKAVKAEPKNAAYLDTYAWILFMRGEYQSAKFYIEQALEYANDPIMLEHYGDILFKLGKIDEALDQWQKAAAAGNASDLLLQKIEKQTYIPDIKKNDL